MRNVDDTTPPLTVDGQEPIPYTPYGRAADLADAMMALQMEINARQEAGLRRVLAVLRDESCNPDQMATEPQA